MSDRRTSIPFILDGYGEEDLHSPKSPVFYRPTAASSSNVTDIPEQQEEDYGYEYGYEYEDGPEPERPRFVAINRPDNAYEYAPNDVVVPSQDENEHLEEDAPIVNEGRRNRLRALDFFPETDGGHQEREQEEEEEDEEYPSDMEDQLDAFISEARQSSRRRLTSVPREATPNPPDVHFTPTPERELGEMTPEHDLAEMTIEDVEESPRIQHYTYEDIHHMSNTKRMLLEQRGVIKYTDAPSPDPHAARASLKLPTRRQRNDWHEYIARQEQIAILDDRDIPEKPYPPPYLTPKEDERAKYYRQHSDRTFMGDYFRIGRSMVRFS